MAKIYPIDAGRNRHRNRNRLARGRLSASVLTLALLSVGMASALWAFAPQGRNVPLTAFAAPNSDAVAANFGFCHAGGGTNCVVDGDTLYVQGTKIRIADIDTPETHDPRCAAEARRGAAATRRLQALVNAGPFSLKNIDRDEDRYGRKLRILVRGGQSLGEILVGEGLARRYEGGREPWC
jgi:micrococcal nuclease